MNNRTEFALTVIAGVIVSIVMIFVYFAMERLFVGVPNEILSVVQTYVETEKHELHKEIISEQLVVNAGDTIYVEYDIDRRKPGRNTIHRYIDSCDGSAILLQTDIRTLTSENIGRKKVLYTFIVPKFTCQGTVTVRTHAIFDRPFNPFFSLFPFVISTLPVKFYYKNN